MWNLSCESFQQPTVVESVSFMWTPAIKVVFRDLGCCQLFWNPIRVYTHLRKSHKLHELTVITKTAPKLHECIVLITSSASLNPPYFELFICGAGKKLSVLDWQAELWKKSIEAAQVIFLFVTFFICFILQPFFSN